MTGSGISVIAPNLNESPYIWSYFLNGLLRQTHSPLEVIIVDGGSTDGSEKEATFTFTERNIGKCRDLAAKRSTGDVILSASTDVYYPPKTIEKLEEAFRDRKIVAVSGRIHPTECGLMHHLAYGFMECFRRLTGLKKPSASLYAVRRSILEDVGGYPHVRIAEGELLGELIEKYARINGFKTLHRGDIYGVHHVKRGERSPFFYLYLFVPQLKNIQGRKFSDK